MNAPAQDPTDTMPTDRTLAALVAEITGELKDSYDLVYVDYRDQLTSEQVAALVRCDHEAFGEALWEFESQSRDIGSRHEVDELAQDIIDRWEREDDADYSELADEFKDSSERLEIQADIESRDDGSWVGRLANQTPDALLRINVLDEDNGYSFEDVAPERVLHDIGLQATEGNMATMRRTLAECSPEFSVLLGYWIVGAEVSDLFELPSDPEAEVEITNPYLYLGNPFAGSGFISEEPFEGTVRVKRSELRTDSDAFGYAVSEIYGGLSGSQFRCELRAVTEDA